MSIYGLNLSFTLLDGSTLQGVDKEVIDLISECRQILFNSKTPPPLQTDYKTLISLPDEKEIALENDHIKKRNEVSELSNEIRKIEKLKDWRRLPEIRERYEALVDYHTSYVPWRGKFVGDTEYFHLQSVVSLLSLWRNYDLDYVYGKIQPYAEKLLSLTHDDSVSSSGDLAIAGAFLELADVFGMAWNMRSAYDCCVNFLKFENFFYRKICFEYSLDLVNEKIKFGYSFYHGIVCRSVTVAFRYDYEIDGLYVELCKRKNMMYLAEAWSHRHGNLTDINQFLGKEIFLTDIRNAIPKETIFIDFIYYRDVFREQQCTADTMTECAHGLAFVMHSQLDNVRCVRIGNISEIATSLNDRNFAEKILADLPQANHIIACTEGNLNVVAFASLPYKNGYILDYFTVRNIGSVYDMIHTRERQDIEDALIIASPDFDYLSPRYYKPGNLHSKVNNLVCLSQREGEGAPTLSCLTMRRQKLGKQENPKGYSRP